MRASDGFVPRRTAPWRQAERSWPPPTFPKSAASFAHCGRDSVSLENKNGTPLSSVPFYRT
jgi:hypothetical protein